MSPLFKAVTLVVYGTPISRVKMSIEKWSLMDMMWYEAKIIDHIVRISMEHLGLRDGCLREEQIRGSNPVSLRVQSSQLVDGQLNQAKGALTQLDVCAAYLEEAGSTDKRQRKMTDNGREDGKKIIDKRKNLVSRIIRNSRCFVILSPE